MRITLYKRLGGSFDVLLVPSIGKGQPPVLLSQVWQDEVKDKVGPEISKMREYVRPTGPLFPA